VAVVTRDDGRLILTFSAEMGTVIYVTLSHLSLLLSAIITGKTKEITRLSEQYIAYVPLITE
jgi:hypothetical protein